MAMRWQGTLAGMKRSEAGVAAIEMGLILPVALIIFFGLIDVTALVADNRRLSYSANLVADLVTRLDSPATAAQVDDIFQAAELVTSAEGVPPTRVEVISYRKFGALSQKAWSRNNGIGTACEAPATSAIPSLMAAGNDIVVAVTCSTFTPFVAQILGKKIMGASQFTIREQIAMRPRFSLTLPCTGC